MKLFFLLLLGTIALLSACKYDTNKSQVISIKGTWMLSNVSGGFAGVNIDYEEGEVFWIFRKSKASLIVENNVDPSAPQASYAGLGSGTYNYAIQKEGEADMLYINSSEWGSISLNRDTLILDDNIAADGFKRKFIRK